MAKQKNPEIFSENNDGDVVMDDAGKIVYVLILKNEKRGRVFDIDGNPVKDPEYQRRRNLLLRSSINWRGGKDPFSGKERARGRYLIRYYDGCDTLFIDDQPKEPTILEPLMAGTRELHFINGKLFVDEYDTMLKTYCDWASWNADSPYRNPRVDAIFRLLDTEEERRAEAIKLDMVEEALALAKKATSKHMRVHARYLKIDDVDEQTMRPLSDDAIRVEYRKAAMHDPEGFVRSFNDKSIHLKQWIELALGSGELSTSLIPNRVVWAKKGSEVCDTSGLTSHEGVLNKLIEFAQTDRGSDFKQQLEALYNR